MSSVLIYDVKNDSTTRLFQLENIVENIIKKSSLKIEGKTVLVKPNMLGAFDPSRGATTDPMLVEAIVNILEKKNAKEVYVGDSPGGADKGTESTAKKCGIYGASKGHFYNFSKDATIINLKSRFAKQISIAKKVQEADILINVPKLKTHGFMGFSGCIKNMFGLVIGPYKAKLHFRAPSVSLFGELLCDIYNIRVPDLNIVDAMVVMEGNGPTSGPTRTENQIIAGADGVMVDTVIAKMIGFDERQIAYLNTAGKRKLGETCLSNIHIEGNFRSYVGFEKPVTYMQVEAGNSQTESKSGSSLNSGGLAALHEISKMVPKFVAPEKCTRCRICATNCPAKAITMNDLPEINYSKCISCYCCAELCHNNCYTIWDSQGKMISAFKNFLKGEENN